jgi:hypothetical protein
MQPSSAAAVVLLIAERNASGVISRFSDGNDTHDQAILHCGRTPPKLPKSFRHLSSIRKKVSGICF